MERSRSQVTLPDHKIVIAMSFTSLRLLISQSMALVTVLFRWLVLLESAVADDKPWPVGS